MEREVPAESSSSASVDEGGEGTFSASSTENNLFEEGSPLAGIEERVLIATRTFLSILSESSFTTTTSTPAPAAESTTNVFSYSSSSTPSI